MFFHKLSLLQQLLLKHNKSYYILIALRPLNYICSVYYDNSAFQFN
nr:MAG TPA: hypothetical protein [Caudoviricetes sp.]